MLQYFCCEQIRCRNTIRENYCIVDLRSRSSPDSRDADGHSRDADDHSRMPMTIPEMPMTIPKMPTTLPSLELPTEIQEIEGAKKRKLDPGNKGPRHKKHTINQ